MTDIVLERHGGLGDVLMALGAAKALSSLGHHVSINTSPKYFSAVSHCPHVRSIMCEPNHGLDLGSVIFGSAQCHQIDAYLQWMGIDTEAISPENKQIEYSYPDVRLSVDDYVMVHTGVYRGGNRGWHKEYWQRVINALSDGGEKVITIGSHEHCGLEMPEFTNIVGSIKCDDVLEMTGIINHAKALVSIDSGPVQMAGATDTRIVALYSVTKPEFRLPYRHGAQGWNATGLTVDCIHHPCYKTILSEENWDDVMTADDINKLYSEYCPAGDYHCLEVNPQLIVEAINA